MRLSPRLRTMHRSKIEIGDRVRKDLGNIPKLAESIEVHGQLRPVTVNTTGKLVAGRRLLAALEHLGRDEVPVRVVDLEDAGLGEAVENAERKDLSPSERVALAERRRPAAEEEALKRMKDGGRGVKTSQPLRVDAVLGRMVGWSGPTLRKATDVVKAANAQPEKYGDLLESLDGRGSVSGVWNRLQVRIKAEKIRDNPPPLPPGKFAVIACDPPWEARSHRSHIPYPPMSVEEIAALPVADLAADDCALWLWAINSRLEESFQVLRSWGFERRSMVTWNKQNVGGGSWLRSQTEFCHMATRGKPVIQLHNQTDLLTAPRRAHSEKPDAIFDLVESLCPATARLEMFARKPRLGWVGWGDEMRDEQPMPMLEAAE